MDMACSIQIRWQQASMCIRMAVAAFYSQSVHRILSSIVVRMQMVLKTYLWRVQTLRVADCLAAVNTKSMKYHC